MRRRRIAIMQKRELLKAIPKNEENAFNPVTTPTAADSPSSPGGEKFEKVRDRAGAELQAS